MLEERDIVVEIALLRGWSCAEEFPSESTSTTTLIAFSHIPLAVFGVGRRSRRHHRCVMMRKVDETPLTFELSKFSGCVNESQFA